MPHFQPQPAGLPSGSFGARRGAGAVSPGLRRLLSAPHRLAFAAASGLLVAAALWWAAMRLAPALGRPQPLLLAADDGFAWLLALGAWPLFLTGLLCAALPRWLGCAPLATRLLLPPLAAVGGGWGLALVGLHTGGLPTADLQGGGLLAALGVALVAVGLALLAGLIGLTWLEHRHRAVRGRPALAAAGGMAALAVAAWGGAVALALGLGDGLQAALQAALWLGLVPMAAALLHGERSTLAPAGTRAGWLQRSSWAWLGIAAGLTLVAPAALPWPPLLLGCLGSLVMARATTEVLQQAGRRPRIDNAVWFSALAAQAAALCATLGALAPVGGQPLALLTAQFWLGAVALWAWHLRPALLRWPATPRG